MTRPTAPTYRHELDGLRAIAVLAVLGYHAGYNDFGGGFMGVDVFLVLSGYLITHQIGAALASGRFHAGRFWLRRVRRLLPAMLPVLAFALLSATLLRGTGAYDAFARHFLSAGFFWSNYQFLSEADYFARASDTNLLLHTWSLSLEWQFYLLTPLVLMATHRGGRLAMAAALLGLGAASLILSESLIAGGRADWAFFGVLPRFWEFAAGGLVALLPPLLPRLPFAGGATRALGLGLILWAIFGYAGGSFPGLGAATAVGGTALVLLAADQPRDPVRWLLEARWLQWVGLRSYAIYLVHWPLFVTVTPADMSNSEGPLSVALLASLLLGHLIYRYVETPVRTGPRFATPGAVLRYGAGALVVIAVVGFTLPSAGVERLRAHLPLADLRAEMTQIDTAREDYLALMTRFNAGELPGISVCSYDWLDGPGGVLDCLTGTDMPEDAVLLIGDSHGRDATIALAEAFPGEDFVMLHQSSCVPATYVRGRSLCFDGLEDVLNALAEEGRLNRVILSSRWIAGEHREAEETLTTLARLGAETLVIGPGPTFDAPMESLALEAAFAGGSLATMPAPGTDRFAFDIPAVNADMARFAAEAGALYADRFAMMCPREACPVFDNGPIYFDEQHLGPQGLTLLAQALSDDPQVRALLADR